MWQRCEAERRSQSEQYEIHVRVVEGKGLKRVGRGEGKEAGNEIERKTYISSFFCCLFEAQLLAGQPAALADFVLARALLLVGLLGVHERHVGRVAGLVVEISGPGVNVPLTRHLIVGLFPQAGVAAVRGAEGSGG